MKRNPDGEIHRSAKAKDGFKKSHPCPSTGQSTGACPGYVIDLAVPLKRCRADAPSNKQWQTKSQPKTKDKTEWMEATTVWPSSGWPRSVRFA